MVDFVHSDLFLQNSIPKKFFIISDTATITNTELHQEKFSLKEALCSESELVLGSCEASEIEFTVSNIFTPQTGKELTVRMVVNKDSNNPFNVGKYKVYSDKPTANRKDRVIKAYDAMHDIINSDVTDWYNRVLPKGSAVTVRQFRDSFISYFGLEQEDITLINDDIILNRTIEPAKLSGKDVITKLCEMNGCFGHIGRNGKFKYIYLRPAGEGLYPREDLYPSENLFPKEINDYRIPKRNYISASSEDYIVGRITRIQIRQDEDDIGGVAGVEGNDYIIQDNFLLYGKDSKELNTIAQKILDKVGGIYYRPFNATVKGNPCVEVGDLISISGKYEIIQSYVLERTLTGIQSLRDKISASGSPSREDKVNGSQSQIIQLQGKYNKLTRTVDETRLEMGDIEKELYATISVTASELRTELSNAKSGLESSINQTASQIRLEVSDIEKDLQSQITQNANAISLRVTSSELESEIAILEKKINLKVDSGDVINEINISDKAIELTAGRLIITSGNFQLHENGDCYIKGEVDATSGYVGGWDINPSVDGTLSFSGGETWITEHDCYFAAIHTDEINGYTPITSGNISTYIDPSEILADAYTSDITADTNTSGNILFNGKTAVSTTYLSSRLSDYVTYDDLPDIPDIILESHLSGGNGYYYTTNSTEATGNSRNIPTVAWVQTYAKNTYLRQDDFDTWLSDADLEFRTDELESRCDDIEDRLKALEATL